MNTANACRGALSSCVPGSDTEARNRHLAVVRTRADTKEVPGSHPSSGDEVLQNQWESSETSENGSSQKR